MDPVSRNFVYFVLLMISLAISLRSLILGEGMIAMVRCDLRLLTGDIDFFLLIFERLTLPDVGEGMLPILIAASYSRFDFHKSLTSFLSSGDLLVLLNL